MSKTEAIMQLAFCPGRPARSAAYRAGVRDVLLKRLDGVQDIPFPYQVGSAEADAYLSGTDEGMRRAKEMTGATPERLVQRGEEIIAAAQSAALQSF